jgi:biopolymer transport protein ExbB
MHLAIYLLLGATSVVGLAFIVERSWSLRWSKVVPPEITASLAACRSRTDVQALCRVCQAKPSPLGRLLLFAATHLDWPKDDNVDALQSAARHEIVRLERGLVVLEIIVGIAPLLGLVGTIAGMMTVFRNVGQAGLNDAAALAQGIALILNATLIGLLIAIPSLIFWSYFSKKVEVFAVEMEALCDEFVRRQYREMEEEVPAVATGESAPAPSPIPSAVARKVITKPRPATAKPQTPDAI